MTTDATLRVFAGIDVGAKELVLVIRKNAVSLKAQTFANTPAERVRLVKRLSAFAVSPFAWRPRGCITSI